MRRTGTTGLICISSMLLAVTAMADRASSEQLPTYYFPGPPLCTVMIDFASSHNDLDALSKDEREARLANRMLQEVAANIGKCGSSTDIRALAVEIPGTDNYGRPNFGARKNLLMIEGSATTVVDRGSNTRVSSLNELKPEFKIVEY